MRAEEKPEAPAPAAAAPLESLAEMNARHLKILRAIQGKALEALRGASFGSASEAAKALEIAVHQERRIRMRFSVRRSRMAGGIFRDAPRDLD